MYNIEGAQWFARHVDARGKSICEFGNQRVWVHAMHLCGGFEIARDWFMHQGAKRYVSIDTNGEDGALVVDLTKPISGDLLERFDIVTDVGCIEHMGNAVEKQWNAFRNAHMLCAPGGVVIHHLPPAGQWLDHCDVWYRDGLGAVLAADTGAELLIEERINLATLNPDVDYLVIMLRKGKARMLGAPAMEPSIAFSKKLQRI